MLNVLKNRFLFVILFLEEFRRVQHLALNGLIDKPSIVDAFTHTIILNSGSRINYFLAVGQF
jgi:hypothetical protein